MAVARALCALSGLPWEELRMVLLGQRVEGEFVGVKGGMMDQFAAVFGREGHAGYRARFDLPSAVFVCRSASGARLLDG